MALHILRDYAAAAAGYFSPGGGVNYFFTPHIYNLSLFLHKILGYSVVGQTAWDINNTFVNTFSNTATVAIAAGSNGQSLPQSTIFGTTTTGFPNNGYIYVTTSAGIQTVKYNGITANSFLNCTGGTGTMSSGVSTTIAAGSNNATLPTGTINVVSTTGFPTSGTIFVLTTTGIQTVVYTGTTATTFTGCTGGNGTMNTGNAVTSASSANGSIACSPIRITTATVGTNTPPTVTTNLPHNLTTGQYVTIANTTSQISNGVWPITVTSPTQFIIQTLAPATFTAGTTAQVYNPGMLVASGTVAGGTGATINVTGASSVYAVSIPPNTRVVQAGAAPSTGDVGRILVLKSSSYPTKNSGLFKISAVNTGNSTTIAAGSNNQTLPQATINVASTTGFPASGTIFIATSAGIQTVTYTGTGATTFTGCSGGSGTMSTGNTVNNFNGYNIDYRSTDTPPTETMDWWLYEIESQVSNYVNYTNYSTVNGIQITAATNTIPIQVTTNFAARGDWLTGQRVTISGATGNTNVNGTWTITVPTPNTTSGIFTLNGSVGNGTFAGSATVTRIGYVGGSNVSLNSRIILQSPHATGWQARLCVEPFNVTTFPPTSVTVGYGGSTAGDFAVGGPHTHLPQWVDSIPSLNTSISNNLMGGSNTNAIAIRSTIIGDDTGQAVFCYERSQGAGANGLITFGIPDNEPSPPPININRPFSYGSVLSSDFGGIQMRFGVSQNFGMTYRDTSPEVCAIAGWVNADGVSGASPAYATNGGDCPFTGTTEVLPWEVWAGIATDPALGLPFGTNGTPPYSLNQRFMGTAPFIRQGRANFGAFTLSTDSTAAFTVSAASNTSPIQITTSATNTLTTGQTVVISGVTGNTAANGTFVITVLNNTQFTLNGTTGNGNYISGGTGNGTPRFLHTQNGIYLQWNGAGGLTP